MLIHAETEPETEKNRCINFLEPEKETGEWVGGLNFNSSSNDKIFQLSLCIPIRKMLFLMHVSPTELKNRK